MVGVLDEVSLLYDYFDPPKTILLFNLSLIIKHT